MPGVPADCAQAGLTILAIKEVMDSIGYSKRAPHMLDRWDPNS